jgi:RNA polymerase sigma-70 factor (ECF subfamily)
VGHHHDTEEVVQETILRLLRRRFDPRRGRLESYLRTIATRVAIDWARRTNRRRTVRLEGQGGIEVRDAGGDPVEAAEAKDRSEELRRAITALPPELRAPVMLLYFGGKTYREVSEILHVRFGTVASRVWRALRKLRGRLGPRLGDSRPGQNRKG